MGDLLVPKLRAGGGSHAYIYLESYILPRKAKMPDFSLKHRDFMLVWLCGGGFSFRYPI